MSLKPTLYNLLYLKPCRVYAKEVMGDKPADAIYRFLCSLQFYKIYKFWPNFVKPGRFSEKIWSRMLHDRNPLWTVINDKFLVRDFVEARVGGGYLIPLLWEGKRPEQIPFDLLPDEFVIKATHGCSYNIIVLNKESLDREKTLHTLRKWLNENYCEDFLIGIEWGYKNIKPRLIIETFVKEKGKYPVDYKFWCFSGHVESISVHFNRFEKHTTRSFDGNFEPGGLKFQLPLYIGEYQRPSNYKEMIFVAESLANGFDFMRVDLYSVDNKIYFSELTPYPGGVTNRFEPENVDRVLGEKWR